MNGTNALTNGSAYSTNVSSTTTYYVESVNNYPGVEGQGGNPANSTSGQYSNSTFHLVFDAMQDLIIDSVMVYAQNAGTRNIELVDANGTQITSGSFDVPAGQSYIALNFAVPQGTGYGLRPVANSQPGLWRDGLGSTLSYPYAITDGLSNVLASITGSTVQSPNTYNYYYFFYDWHVSTPSFECSTGLLPVTVYVGNVLGCMSPDACNYNPVATTEDNSCIYPGSPCDDGDATTINDVLASDCSCVGETVGVNNVDVALGFGVYPNPTQGILTMQFPAVQGTIQLSVLDVNGRMVDQRSVNGLTQSGSLLLDVSHLASGWYNVKMVSELGVHNLRFQKN
jgi:hypothetical protein